ncbi:MAG: glycosyltransferase family 2 protein [Planctomycetota bacterium]
MQTDLVIPARNEAENMPALIAAVDAARATAGLRRVVLADNGSTDGTADLARAGGFEVVYESQPGYGAACLAALDHLRADPPDAVAFLDADLADDPAHLIDVLAPIAEGSADLALGQRQRLAEPGALDPHQRFGNWLATSLLRVITGRAYRDLGPMRALRWRSLEKLAMADRTWGWTVEMQYKAARYGLRIAEVDVPYRKRHAGKSKISGSLIGSLRAGTKIIATLAHLWWTTPKRLPTPDPLGEA